MGCCFTLTAGEDKGFAVASSAALPLPPESSIRAIPGCGCDRMWSGWRVGGVDGRPSSSSSIRLSNSDGAGRAILTGERQTRSRAWWLLQGFPVPAATPVPVLDTDGCRPALTQAQCSPAPLPSGSGIPLRAQIAEFFCRIHKVVAAPANEWGREPEPFDPASPACKWPAPLSAIMATQLREMSCKGACSKDTPLCSEAEVSALTTEIQPHRTGRQRRPASASRSCR